MEPHAAKRNQQKHALNDIYSMINMGLLNHVDEVFIYGAATDVTLTTKFSDFYLQDLVKAILSRLRMFRAETDGQEEWAVTIIKHLDAIQSRRIRVLEDR